MIQKSLIPFPTGKTLNQTQPFKKQSIIWLSVWRTLSAQCSIRCDRLLRNSRAGFRGCLAVFPLTSTHDLWPCCVTQHTGASTLSSLLLLPDRVMLLSQCPSTSQQTLYMGWNDDYSMPDYTVLRHQQHFTITHCLFWKLEEPCTGYSSVKLQIF